MVNEQENKNQTKKRKAPVRSPYLFPAYDFGEARRISERVERDGGGSLTEETLAIALHLSAKSSGFKLRALTARQFKLLAKQGQHLITTPLAKSMLKPVSEQERNNAVTESFMSIPLFRAVATRFKGQTLPQGEAFRNILEREFKIPGARVGAAERALMDSAREAGLLHTAGDKVYLTTEFMPTGQQPVVTGIQPSYAQPTSPNQMPESRGIREGGILTVSEQDLTEFDDNEFDEIWQALGKIVRIRGKRQRDKEEQVAGEETEEEKE